VSENPDESPFHPGEQAIQSRCGVRDQAEDLGGRFIRDYLPDQHRQFYQRLAMLVVGSVDSDGRPWASLLVGKQGFIQSPDEFTLRINTPRIFGDPLERNLAKDVQLGALGILYGERRRNRLSAQVTEVDASSFTIKVDQTFGNCPQYIQAREPEFLAGIDQVGIERPVAILNKLDNRCKAIIEAADHFFIATHYSEDPGDVRHGADASHRGGKPGFVRVENDQTLVFPDYTGNNHFNTLGNISLNPRAGLLFIDFEHGDMLYLTCQAQIIWDSEEKRAFTGAERLVRFTVDELVLVEKAMPIRWRFVDYSPSLDRTGDWADVSETIATRKMTNTQQPYRVTKIEQESDVIKSFYLQPVVGRVHSHKPGQFLPIEIPALDQDQDKTIKRTYTISNAPNGSYFRLSIKREPSPGNGLPPGRSSSYFHDVVEQGSIIRAIAPRGTFVLQETSKRAVVLLSTGVGITPMISMLEELQAETSGCGRDRPIWFIHGARNGREHAFSTWLKTVSENWRNLRTHIVYSRPDETDVLDQDYDQAGRIGISMIKGLLPFDDYDFYICGPGIFMQDMYQALKELNIADDRIHYEFFGPGATLLKEEPGRSDGLVGEAETRGPVEVTFLQSHKTATWDPSKGTLLELAEAEGLKPEYSCRSGICATCETRIVSGDVAYTDPPLGEPETGHALICCAYPKSGEKFVLDL
jgi:ferredoxin-NADP reductase/predicted pyridoxine 5'-phosphate oxidase superfamily flavin-nucleotide-binding protein